MENDMEWKGRYKSEIYEVIHQDAMANFEIGAISKAEMQKFDKMCLVQEPEKAYAAEKSPKTEYAPSLLIPNFPVTYYLLPVHCYLIYCTLLLCGIPK
jgi:putative transcriptional regulator